MRHNSTFEGRDVLLCLKEDSVTFSVARWKQTEGSLVVKSVTRAGGVTISTLSVRKANSSVRLLLNFGYE